MPPILIVLQTYERTSYALDTIRAAQAHLRYGDGFKWFVTDDGSRPDHVRDIEAAIGAENIAGTFSRRVSYGACANQAWAFAARSGYDLTLWLEDDWVTKSPLDLTLYATLLLGTPSVGMVRLGHFPPGLDARTETYNGYAYLWYQPTTPYAFSGNPSLRHRRLWEAVGNYPENEQPGETERIYEAHIRDVRGAPKIVHPIDIGTYGMFQHIGVVKSF